ncbi:Slp family lipoprotein [Pelotalea chapellei]|uniref:Slp family lipoprotein n=1 Tax=Pelotalea chapellei TaxID=44671 RepID=A0ABS5U8Q4_9BACT|nr:Slp family lipoprotein [Pelotalea chapellei]MBT1072063.1 Slp family lipoprotein [Pelotalea chapellei]
MKQIIFTLLAVLLLLNGCSHVMSEANLKLAEPSVNFAALAANPEAFVGKIILVGGIIVEVQSSGDISQIEVSQLELLKNGVPDEDSNSGGHFLALTSQLIDPEVYRPGQLVTLIGEVKGKKVQKLQDVDYSYPLLATRELRPFRSSEPFTRTTNPYQNQFGDEKFLGRPPGLADGEPRRLY